MKNWESYLDPTDRERLEATRKYYNENYPGDLTFARNWVQITHSPDFYEELAEAQTPEEKAEVHYAAEMRAYPFKVVYPDSPFYDV